MVYARDTNVSVNRTREEIITTLERYGADAFGYAQDGNQQVVFFRMEGRRVRLMVEMPNPEEFAHTPTGIRRTGKAHMNAYDRACRQPWRAMLLLIKAKLEGVALGITTVEEESLAHIYLPDGRTVGEFMRPQIEESYSTGRMPPMLPMLPPGRTD